LTTTHATGSPPPIPLSKETLFKYKPPSIKQEPEDGKLPALGSANPAGLKLRSPKKAAEVNKQIHSLHWGNMKHEGLPALIFFIEHNGDLNDLTKDFGNSYAEKYARDIFFLGDSEGHGHFVAIGFDDKIYDLYINGMLKKNTGKYPIKVFLILLEKPATDEQAYQTACEFANLVNRESKNKPHLSVPRFPSPFHPAEDLKLQDVMQNEQSLAIITKVLGNNPANIPNFGHVHSKIIEACFRPGSLCPAVAAILALGNEWVHPSFLSVQDQNLLRVAGVYHPEEQEDEEHPEDAEDTEDHQEDGENEHLQNDAMEEDSLEEEEAGDDDEDEEEGNDDNEADDDDHDFADQNSFIVEDGEEESDGSFHEH